MIDLSSIDEDQELWFKAEMTHRQFASLAHKLQSSEIENEIINLPFFKDKLEKAKNLDLAEVEKWLKNSWNTENVLVQNEFIIETTGQSFAMQWAFPQAYYSVFGSVLAHYKALGYTQESHTGVLKQYGLLAEQHKLPECASFYCIGAKKKIEYKNIVKPNGLGSMDFDIANDATIDNQICQFLKSTRDIKLVEKAPDMKFKTKKGGKLKKLSPSNWQIVSGSLGNTTILDLLYRKRIKANYHDIETFASNQFKGKEVLSSLCSIVDRLNLINECYIGKAVGLENLNTMLEKHLKQVENKTVKARFGSVKSIVESVAK